MSADKGEFNINEELDIWNNINIENITFTETSCQLNDNFDKTVAYVRDFASSWVNPSGKKRSQICGENGSRRSKYGGLHLEESHDRSVVLPCTQHTALQAWGLPEQILNKYKSRGITHMFPWQVECLGNSRVLNENKNLLYSAPTSAGKTLVAELLAIKTLLERQKKVLFILPFVSVVREKMFYLQDILTDSGVRVEGFMGAQSPPGGLEATHVAVCTIEKANSLLNHLLQENKVDELGTVIVDELHLLGDPHRGYILELLLTKILYMTKKYEHVKIQIVGMSATLPNLSMLSDWLDAELYKTDFRPIPLHELCQIDNDVYNCDMELVRTIDACEELQNDPGNVVRLCLETIANSCSVLIFCPSKNWCENLAKQISSTFRSLGYSKASYGNMLRQQLNGAAINEVLEQLKNSPVGLDDVLCETISFGVAFHHAGLTMDERDIIEGAFKSNTIRVLVATSTLSSGVNLPARRVIIRSPMFHSKPIDILTYKQMVGRAGRMGIDSEGESILICPKNNQNVAQGMLTGSLEPISSCLAGGDKLLRAVLESIASCVASTPSDVLMFTESTLLLTSLSADGASAQLSEETVKLLEDYELIRLQKTDEELFYLPTLLGKACLSSSMSPKDGLTLFRELQKARECFVLETDLHMVYLVTPYSICSQWGSISWLHYVEMWDGLSRSMRRVGELVGVQESFLYQCMRGTVNSNLPSTPNKLQVVRRFYTALALQDLVNEVPLCNVAQRFGCSRGMLQSLQQSAATFAGMVTAFSRQLGWKSFELLVSQFQNRLHFGIQAELLDLMRLQSLNGVRARALFNANIETIAQLASANVCSLENALHSAVPFSSEKERDGEEKCDVRKRNTMKSVWITGRKGVTTREAAELLIQEARDYLQKEIGITEGRWSPKDGNTSPVKENIIKAQVNADESGSMNEFILDTPPSKDKLSMCESTSHIVMNSDCLLAAEHSTPNQSIANNKNDSVKLHLNSDENNSIQYMNSEIMLAKMSFHIELCKDSDLNSPHVSDTSGTVCKSLCNESKDLSIFEDSFPLNSELCEMLDDIPKDEPVGRNTNETETCKASRITLENVFCTSFSETAKSTSQLEAKVVDLSSQMEDIIINSQQVSSVRSPFYRSKNSFTKLKSQSVKNVKNGKRKINEGSADQSNKENARRANQSSMKQRKLLQRNKLSTLTIEMGNKLDWREDSESLDREISIKKTEILNATDDYYVFKLCCDYLNKCERLAVYFEPCTKSSSAIKNPIGSNILRRGTNKSSKLNLKPEASFPIKGIAVCAGIAFSCCFDLKNSKISIAEVLLFLERLFGESWRSVVMLNVKTKCESLYRAYKITVKCRWEDPGVADWLLDPEGEPKTLTKMVEAFYSTCENVRWEQTNSVLDGACRQLCIKAHQTWCVMEMLEGRLQEKHSGATAVLSLEMKALKVLADAEMKGMKVNRLKAEQIISEIKAAQKCLESNAYKACGQKFRLTSSTEVAKVLGMYEGRKTSTNKQKLQSLNSEVADMIVYWRKLNSIMTKNLIPLMAKLTQDADATQIFSSYWTHTSTGRIIMQEPNLQSTPRNFEISSHLLHQAAPGPPVVFSCRGVFPASKGRLLVSADYCQLELRLLAHLSGDAELRRILTLDGDIFKAMASSWRGVPEEQVDDVLRQSAKQLCYGIVYGMGTAALAQSLELGELEASAFLASFHSAFPCVRLYTAAVMEQCRSRGHVETLSGRRRYLPAICSHKLSEKSHAERQAVNTTIQGSAADILKSAMVGVHQRLQDLQELGDISLVLPLHDELMYEVPEGSVQVFACLLKECMESAVSLTVPLPVKLKCGKTWGEMRDL